MTGVCALLGLLSCVGVLKASQFLGEGSLGSESLKMGFEALSIFRAKRLAVLQHGQKLLRSPFGLVAASVSYSMGVG